MRKSADAEDLWDPSEEEGLTPSDCVVLAHAIQKHSITLEYDNGFVATVDGERWNRYGILSELLEDLGGVG